MPVNKYFKNVTHKSNIFFLTYIVNKILNFMNTYSVDSLPLVQSNNLLT